MSSKRIKYSSNIRNFDRQLGHRITLIRGTCTQAVFAEQIGVRQGTLSKYEHGMVPSEAVLKRIAQTANCPVEWLRTGSTPHIFDRSTSRDFTHPLPAGVESSLSAIIQAALIEVPGADVILLRNMQRALTEVSESAWVRRYGGRLQLEASRHAIIGPYSSAAREWCARWEQESNAIPSEWIDLLPAGAKILDIGCGSGRDLSAMLQAGFDAYGIEPVPQLRMAATELHPELGTRITDGILPGLGRPFGGDFQGILCVNVFQEIFLEDLYPAAIELRSLIRPSGVMLLTLPQQADTPVGNDKPPFRLLPSEGLIFLLSCAGFRLAAKHSMRKKHGHHTILVFRANSETHSV